MKKVKEKISEGSSFVKDVAQGIEDFVISTALLITAFYNYQTLSGHEAPFEYWSRLVASVVIGLYGSWALVQFFKRKK